MNYDLKDEIENLSSSKINKINFPDIFLFQPETVITLNKNVVEISCLNKDPKDTFNAINRCCKRRIQIRIQF